MSKLTKAQTRKHLEAEELLKKDALTYDEKWQVLEDWHPGASHLTGVAGVFFTPSSLAADFAIDVSGHRIVDTCAGIGALSFMSDGRWQYSETKREYVCIEQNPAFVEIGKKIMPHATWICGDVTDPAIWAEIGHFDCAIGNPPFGRVKTGAHKPPRYTGSEFELKVIDIASDHADEGVFIVPQGSTPFRYSGARNYQEVECARFQKFHQQTGIPFYFNCGIDTSFHQDDWKDAKPCVEIVCPNFEEARQARAPHALQDVWFEEPLDQVATQGDLFAA